MKDYYFFLKRFFSNPSSIGSIFPSSRKLAKQMTKKTSCPHTDPVRYLEVGAGSGALTKHIAKKIQADDTLDIVEMDRQFCKILNRKYGHLPNITVHEISILDFDQKDYDVVISSLPLNSFNSNLVDQVLLKYKYLAKDGGYVSYFEYIGLGKIKKLYLSGKLQMDFKTILSLKDSFVSNYCTEKDKIWWNFPPARIFHCQMEEVIVE